jgi:BON domain
MEGFPMTSWDYEENTGRLWTGFLAGAGVGAAFMYLIDPGRGARRRGLIRDKLIHATHVTADGVDAASRDLAHRAQGLWAEAHNWFDTEHAPDDVLVGRVRARLGRYVSHPHAVEVTAEGGRVTLRGQILKHEIRPLLRAIARIPGVHEIDNQLDQHETAGDIPSLQGGVARRGSLPDVLQTSWSPATRTLVGSIGSALVAYGAARRDAIGTLFGAAGAGLVVRAATNRELSLMVGTIVAGDEKARNDAESVGVKADFVSPDTAAQPS